MMMSSKTKSKRVSRLISHFENLTISTDEKSVNGKELWETTQSQPQLKRCSSLFEDDSVEDIRWTYAHDTTKSVINYDADDDDDDDVIEVKRFNSIDNDRGGSIEDVRSQAMMLCEEYAKSLQSLGSDDVVKADEESVKDEECLQQVVHDKLEVLENIFAYSDDDDDEEDEPLYMNIDFHVKSENSYRSSGSTVSVEMEPSEMHEEPIYENVQMLSNLRRNASTTDLVTMRSHAKTPEDDQDQEKRAHVVKTIYDSMQNIRMQMVSAVHVNEIRKSINKSKMDYIVEELMHTEIKYLESLEYAINNYKSYVTERFKNGPKIAERMFCNIEQIYKQTSALLEEIKAKKDKYEEVGKIFKKHKNLFDLYPVYCRNKQESNRLVTDIFKNPIRKREEELGDKLGLSSYLLKPVQRLGKYELLLKNLSKCMKKDNQSTDHVDAAVDIVVRSSKRANDLLTLKYISDNPHSFRETGEFIYQDTFQILQPKRMEMEVLLFKKMVIFATRDSKDSESLQYHHSIDKNSLSIKHNEDSCTFRLSNYFLQKKDKYNDYKLKAKDFHTKEKWTKAIFDLLWEQLNNQKEELSKQRRYSEAYKDVQRDKENNVIESDIVLKNSTFYTSRK
ncbi:PREDICTED: kalirin-like [Nicrophorus vespilloides]|uniref:Kalirin-like n=1 Tax=Nicrophorus vespilloides TaxID=110193 RepID=A0ABM1M556_NICVS|nr:PREDICTED: kalirin-like [Nicrophorus vespilloides]